MPRTIRSRMASSVICTTVCRWSGSSAGVADASRTSASAECSESFGVFRGFFGVMECLRGRMNPTLLNLNQAYAHVRKHTTFDACSPRLHIVYRPGDLSDISEA